MWQRIQALIVRDINISYPCPIQSFRYPSWHLVEEPDLISLLFLGMRILSESTNRSRFAQIIRSIDLLIAPLFLICDCWPTRKIRGIVLSPAVTSFRERSRLWVECVSGFRISPNILDSRYSNMIQCLDCVSKIFRSPSFFLLIFNANLTYL